MPQRSKAGDPGAAKRSSKAAVKGQASGQLSGGRARDREVIEAAVEVFAERGYANASVQDVAERLGMLKGSLYYYINSKESLLRKIFDDSHDEISRLTEAAMVSGGTGLQRLTLFLTDYAMWTLTNLNRAGLYSRERRYASPETKGALAEYSRYYDRSLRSLIVTCQDEGSIPAAVDPRVVSMFIWSAFTALPDWYNPTRDTKQAVADRYVAMALRAAGVSDASDNAVNGPTATSGPEKSAPEKAGSSTKKAAAKSAGGISSRAPRQGS